LQHVEGHFARIVLATARIVEENATWLLMEVNRLAKTGNDRDQLHSFAQSISV
jgi:fatty acid-binding protein DegV